MREYTDEKLVELYQSGEKDVFEIIYERYKNMIRSCARGFFLVDGDYEDLLQEGLIGLHNAVNTFNGKSEFSTYAYTCIKNAIISAVVRGQSKKNEPLNTSVPINGHTDEFLNLYLNPEDEIIGKENAKELLEKINAELSPFEITVLKLYMEGHSYQLIAEKLNKTAKSIDNALQRIKNKISKILNKD